MAEHFLYNLRMDALRKQEARTGMSQRVEGDAAETGLSSDFA